MGYRERGAEVVVWVQVPSIVPLDRTVVRVKYGDSAAPRATGPVWSPSYVAVLHLGEVSGAPEDATRRYAAVRSERVPPIPSRIGGGRQFVGSAKQADQMSTGAVEQMPATISGWMKVFSASQGAIAYHALIT
jgi:hypothetical protein